jgi:hypothetical protein
VNKWLSSYVSTIVVAVASSETGESIRNAVALVAPSPDWFAGVDVNLMENGNFVVA